MKKAIHKEIFENRIEEYSISPAVSSTIKNCLFKNPQPTDRMQLFFLKDEITEEKLLKNLNKDLPDGFITALKDIFIIKEDLNIPIDLKKKILKNENVAVFMGAGVSKLLGYPRWTELADNAIYYLFQQNRINHFEYEKLKLEVSDPKQKISIFEKFYNRKTNQCQKFYRDQFKDNNKGISNEYSNPYEILAAKEFNFLKITSNIDNELYKANENIAHQKQKSEESIIKYKSEHTLIPKKIYRNIADYELNTSDIYYLHGHIDEIENIVFTTEDYINNYFSKTGEINEFLKEVFSKYTVLFIGYGLGEFPILEPILNDDKPNKHYALFPTYYNEMNIFNINSKYFDSLNISTIPYYIDSMGYKRLIYVLENWLAEIKSEREKDNFYEKINLIDKNL